jgi:hypothetical protein
VELAFLIEERIDALAQAHQHQRHRVVADREHDRIVALEQRELIHRRRDRMGVGDHRRLVDRPDLHFPVLVEVQGFERIIE